MRRHRIIDDAVEDGWLILRRKHVPCEEIAREAGFGVRRVQLGIAAARRRESEIERTRQPSRPGPGVRPPRLTLCFGASCKPLAVLTCDDVHRGPIPHGSACCCGVCHRSGRDRHPALVLDIRDIPTPDKKPKPKPPATMTRRQRRAWLRLALAMS